MCFALSPGFKNGCQRRLYVPICLAEVEYFLEDAFVVIFQSPEALHAFPSLLHLLLREVANVKSKENWVNLLMSAFDFVKIELVGFLFPLKNMNTKALENVKCSLTNKYMETLSCYAHDIFHTPNDITAPKNRTHYCCYESRTGPDLGVVT